MHRLVHRCRRPSKTRRANSQPLEYVWSGEFVCRAGLTFQWLFCWCSQRKEDEKSSQEDEKREKERIKEAREREAQDLQESLYRLLDPNARTTPF
jgi:hypothetical protein